MIDFNNLSFIENKVCCFSSDTFEELTNQYKKRKVKIFYVYALVDDLNYKIFYIGKGTKNRCLLHLVNTKSGRKMLNTHKYNYIKKVLDNNKNIYVNILYVSEIESEVLTFEEKIIDFIGLENLTNIVKGGKNAINESNEINEKRKKSLKGRVFSDEHKRKIGLLRKNKPMPNKQKLKIKNTLDKKLKSKIQVKNLDTLEIIIFNGFNSLNTLDNVKGSTIYYHIRNKLNLPFIYKNYEFTLLTRINKPNQNE